MNTTSYRYGQKIIKVTEVSGIFTLESNDNKLIAEDLQEAILWMQQCGSRKIRLNDVALEKII